MLYSEIVRMLCAFDFMLGLIYLDWCKLGAKSLKADLVCTSSRAERSGAVGTLQTGFVHRAAEKAVCFGERVAGASQVRGN